MGHARALLALEQRRKQIEVASLVAKKGLSVRETEALVRRLQTPAAVRAAEDGTVRDPNVHSSSRTSPKSSAPGSPSSTAAAARASSWSATTASMSSTGSSLIFSKYKTVWTPARAVSIIPPLFGRNSPK